VVIAAPAAVASNHIAALLLMASVHGADAPKARSAAAVVSASATPASTSKADSRSRLSRKRWTPAATHNPTTDDRTLVNVTATAPRRE